jgi:hypothetical protein
MMTVALGGDDTRAIHAKLKPIVDTPIQLRPLAYFFVPLFDAYFDADKVVAMSARGVRMELRDNPGE